MRSRRAVDVGVVHLWSPHIYVAEGERRGLSEDLLNTAVEQIESLEFGSHKLPSLLSLNHLSVRTDVPYLYLRGIVNRSDHEAYRKFSIRKRSGGRRFIHVPAPGLGIVQRWMNTHILRKVPPHQCSYAFSPGSSIIACASRHCGARWLIKMDITGFFESISEIQVYRVFLGLGYQPLVAFELARLTTIGPADFSPRHNDRAWKVLKDNESIPTYSEAVLGYLPQGAPSSPMLSNLVMKNLDQEILSAAKDSGLTYTRYSDDLTFSTRRRDFRRQDASALIHDVQKIISPVGFRPQHRKTKVVSPGSRKIVLGLLVDEKQPRLRKEFKDNLRQHMYFLEKRGPAEHAKARNFHTLWGMKCHLRGLIDFAKMVEPDYSKVLLDRFVKLDWPD